MGSKERELRLSLVYVYLRNYNRDCRDKKFLLGWNSNWIIEDLELITCLLVKLGIQHPMKDFLISDYYVKSVNFTSKFNRKLFDYVTKRTKESTRIISVIDYLQHLREAETVLARVIQADKEKVHEIWYDLVDLIFDDPDYVHKIHTLIKD